MTDMPDEIYGYDYKNGKLVKFVYGGPSVTGLGDAKYIRAEHPALAELEEALETAFMKLEAYSDGAAKDIAQALTKLQQLRGRG